MVTKKNKPLTEIKFDYIFEDDYKPEYVSGAHGGTTPRGDVVLNFYFERHGLPFKENFKIKEDGTLEEKSSHREPAKNDPTLIRQVMSGVIMSQQTAREIRDFLNYQLGSDDKNEEGDE